MSKPNREEILEEIVPHSPGFHLTTVSLVPQLNEELCFHSPVQISFHPLTNARLVRHTLISTRSLSGALYRGTITESELGTSTETLLLFIIEIAAVEYVRKDKLSVILITTASLRE